MGWLCVHTVAELYPGVNRLVPWFVLLLLLFLGGKMILESRSGPEEENGISAVGLAGLLLQGVATAIDALSVGFTIAEYSWQALTAFLSGLWHFVWEYGTIPGEGTVPAMEFTHFDSQGNARMVGVSEKSITARTATAVGSIQVSPEVYRAIEQKTVKKGDVLTVAQVAGILGTKRTAELIPMCHLLNLTNATLTFEMVPESSEVRAFCTVKTEGKTGVEMEALTGVSVALLTIYDMCKAIDRRMVMKEIHLVEKHGGKSGDFFFEEDEAE